MEYLVWMLHFLLDVGIVIICLIFIGAYWNVGETLGHAMDSGANILGWKIFWPILLSALVLFMALIYAYKTTETLFLSFVSGSKHRISDIFDGTIQF